MESITVLRLHKMLIRWKVASCWTRRPLSGRSFCPSRRGRRQSRCGIRLVPVHQTCHEIIEIWCTTQLVLPVLQIFHDRTGVLRWSQHPNQYERCGHPIWCRWWSAVHPLRQLECNTCREVVNTLTVITGSASKTYSIKQKPQGVLVYLSRPIMILLTSPHLENSSWIYGKKTKKTVIFRRNVPNVLNSTNLFFRREKWHIANIECTCLQKQLLLLSSRTLIKKKQIKVYLQMNK